jgi:GTP-binding protein Era
MNEIPATPFRSGSVALVGWTNVGKSTLLNHLVGDQIAAVADVAQTTRNRITGVANVDGAQIAFLDTPGMHRPRHAMNRRMVELVRNTAESADVIVHLIDAARGLGRGDAEVATLLQTLDLPWIVALNKVDLVQPKSRLMPMLEKVAADWNPAQLVPISARSGNGVPQLIQTVVRLLPEGPPLYPDDYLTDQTERRLVAERVREKLLHATHQELPHATAVLVERWHEREDGLLEVDVTILVDRDSQKPIVIGRDGQVLKKVGSSARLELEEFLGRKLFLRLWVRVRRDWRNDANTLRELGLDG